MTLEDRFNEFVKLIEGAEVIDDLQLTPEQKKRKKSDFFFESGQIICELKTLREDMGHKVSRALEKLYAHSKRPILYDEDSLHEFLRYLNFVEEIDKKTASAVVSSVDNAVEGANRQIRSTKQSFKLKDSVGVLVILNETVDVLSPPLVGAWLQSLFCKRTPEGQVRFPHLTAALFISECHYMVDTPEPTQPVTIVQNDFAENSEAGCNFLGKLLQGWADYNKSPLRTLDSKSPLDLNCRSFTERRIIIL